MAADSTESPEYDEVLSIPSTDDIGPSSFSVLARRGAVDLRVVLEWTER